MCLYACLLPLSSESFDVYFSLREYKKKHKDISVELDCQQQMLVQLQQVGEVASTSVALLAAAMVFPETQMRQTQQHIDDACCSISSGFVCFISETQGTVAARANIDRKTNGSLS